MNALRRVRRLPRATRVWIQIGLVLAIGAALGPLPVLAPDEFNLHRLAFFVLWYAILASAWNVIGGYVGQISFGHSAFLGVGAYTTGILWFAFGWDPLLTLPVAGLVAAGYSVLVGAPTLRLRGPYFAIATIGVGEATRLLAVNFDDVFGVELTHGVTGLSLPTYDPVLVHYATVGLFVAMMLATIAVRAGRLGLGLFAINMDRDAAETAGVPTARLQIVALAISAFFAGSAGTLYAARQEFLDPSTMFSFNISIALVLMPVVGGVGTVWGPVLGAVLYAYVQDQITSMVNNPYLPSLIYGVLLIVIVLFEPLGLAGVIDRFTGAARRLVRGPTGEEEVVA